MNNKKIYMEKKLHNKTNISINSQVNCIMGNQLITISLVF